MEVCYKFGVVFLIILIVVIVYIIDNQRYRLKQRQINEKSKDIIVGNKFTKTYYDENPFERHTFIIEVIEIKEQWCIGKYMDGSTEYFKLTELIEYWNKLN